MLEVREASVVFPASDGSSVQALDRVSLDLPPDSIVVAVGASGCGKSTLLNAIAGFLPLTEGSIRLDGEPIEGPGGDRGVVFQKDTLLPWGSVLDNVALGLRYKGVPKRERHE
ncbi:MAG: ATP-binding cassette domain-containing protein, partial [Hyphomicrobiales bacterium]|nr:ATP-binding cassette domain-containing protein [Hyphomicrobiales bacterium]